MVSDVTESLLQLFTNIGSKLSISALNFVIYLSHDSSLCDWMTSSSGLFQILQKNLETTSMPSRKVMLI